MASTSAAAVGNTGEPFRRIELTITDLRATTWANVPKAEREQKNAQKNFIVSGGPELKSFKTLFEKIKQQIQLHPAVPSDSKYYNGVHNFVICTPDREEIEPSNCASSFNNGDSLILLDNVTQDPLPFTYHQIINTTPHTRAVTMQDGAYFGDENHNAAAFALAELVDNSLAATARNFPHLERKIEIRFYDSGESSCLHVLDNGRGMNSETLKSGLKYKAPKDARRELENRYSDFEGTMDPDAEEHPDDQVHPIFINSNISKFGAGLKKAAFYLGGSLGIMTKTIWSNNVQEIHYSKEGLDANEAAKLDNPWHVTCFTGAVGQLRDPSVSALTKKLIQTDEPGKPKFTHVVIEKLQDSPVTLDLLRIKDTSLTRAGSANPEINSITPCIEKQLAHIYHYYIHGRNGNTEASHGQGPVSIIVSRYDSRGHEISSVNLADLPKSLFDLESAFIRTAADSYLFTASVSKYNDPSREFKVGGVIRYHPYLYSKETIPCGPPARKVLDRTGSIDELGKDDDDDVEMTDGGATLPGGDNTSGGDGEDDTADGGAGTSSSANNSSSPTKKCRDFFTIWWNGRLIPLTPLPSFDWCSPGRGAKQAGIEPFFDRISGSIFFDSNVDIITDNKLNFTTTSTLVEMFNEKKIGSYTATFHRVTKGVNGLLRASRVKGKVEKDFQSWLKGCHRKHDKQVVYKGFLGKERSKNKYFYLYKEAEWNGISLTKGNVIKMLDTSSKPSNTPTLGKIIDFLVEVDSDDYHQAPNSSSQTSTASSETPPEEQHRCAPLSNFRMEMLPALFYGDTKVRQTRKMLYIDTKCVKDDAKAVLARQEAELDLKLVIKDMDGKYKLGEDKKSIVDPVSIDSTLFKTISFDVVKKNGGASVGGFLAQKTPKPISVVFRIHKININGGWELFQTGAICPYVKHALGDAYYFKSQAFELKKNLSIGTPGKYIITFRAYVDIHEGLRKKASTSSRASKTSKTTHTTQEASSTEEGAPIEEPYEIEWDKPIDTLGRKILVCDNKKLRLPYYSIEFNVIAGAPTHFTIEDIGEENTSLLIGQKFPIYLSFTDSSGNKTSPPTSTEELIPKNRNSLISVIANKRGPTDMSFTWDSLGKVDDSVVIDGIVAKGNLGNFEFKSCKLAVTLLFGKKLITCTPTLTKFHVGPPVSLYIRDSSIEVENGTPAKILCQVLDISGNLVTHTQENKPIILNCTLYKDHHKLMCCDLLGASNSSRYEETSTPIELQVKPGSAVPSLPITLDCLISYSGVSTPIHIPVQVNPSSQPTTLRIFGKNVGEVIDPDEIRNGDELEPNLGDKVLITLKLFDGLGRQVKLDPKIHKLDLNAWPKKCKTKDPKNLVLYIATKAKTKREIITLCHFKTPDGAQKTLKHEFCFTSKPGEPHKIKVYDLAIGPSAAADVSLRSQVRLGEKQVNVVVIVEDAYGNLIKDTMDEDMISGVHLELENYEDLDFRPICKLDDPEFSGSFLVQFTPPFPPFPQVPCPFLGEKDVDISFGALSDTLRLNMIPGTPIGLAFEVDGALCLKSRSTLPVMNMSIANIRIHLVDRYFNPTPAIADTLIQLELGRNSDWANKGKIPSVLLKAGQEGIANFGNIVIGVGEHVKPKRCGVTSKSCGGNRVCFQDSLYLEAKGHTTVAPTTQKQTPPPSLVGAITKFHIGARPDAPAHLKVLNRNSNGVKLPFVYTAGSPSFDHLSVYVEAENGDILSDSRGEDLFLHLSGKTNHVGQFQIPPSSVIDGIYSFGQVPKQIGVYEAKFKYDNGFKNFDYNFDELTIISGPAVALKPEEQATNSRVVAQTFISGVCKELEGRTIAKNLRLILKDRFDNPVKLETRQTDETEMMGQDDENNLDLEGHVTIQLFAQNTNQALTLENEDAILHSTFPIINGSVSFPVLAIKTDPELKNNSHYLLSFFATLKNGYTTSHELHFKVFNDVSVRQEIQGLEANKSRLESLIREMSKEVKIISTQEKTLKASLDKAERAEMTKRTELRSVIPVNEVGQLRTPAHIVERERRLAVAIQQLHHARNNGGRAEPRVKAMPRSSSDDPDILNRVGRLVTIQSEGRGLDHDFQLQRVLSWHLQGRLNVIPVLNRATGHALRQAHNEEIMFLDIVQDPRTGVDWSTRISDPQLVQHGHPIYARSLLQINRSVPAVHVAAVKKVFNILLRDTIIVDDLQSATDFMSAYNRLNHRGGAPCPTIITRDGNRLESNGIAGGNKNIAPELHQLHCRFGLGPCAELANYETEAKLLIQLKSAIDMTQKAKIAHEAHLEENKIGLERLELEVTKLESQFEELRRELDNKKSEYQKTPTKVRRASQVDGGGSGGREIDGRLRTRYSEHQPIAPAPGPGNSKRPRINP